MKPIIIFKEKNANGTYEFTPKELDELIEQVYNAGIIDGKAQSQPVYIPQSPIPQSPSVPQEIKPWWQQPYVWYGVGTNEAHGTPDGNIKAIN